MYIKMPCETNNSHVKPFEGKISALKMMLKRLPYLRLCDPSEHPCHTSMPIGAPDPSQSSIMHAQPYRLRTLYQSAISLLKLLGLKLLKMISVSLVPSINGGSFSIDLRVSI